MAVTGIRTKSLRVSAIALREGILETDEVWRTIEHAMAASLLNIVQDGRKFLVTNMGKSGEEDTRGGYIYSQAVLVLLENRQDTQIGEYAFASEEHEWCKAKLHNYKPVVTSTFPGSQHMTFTPVTFQFGDNTVQAWVRTE